jgi:alkylation response protein AidB-like acyl-CoA dehydrogenase
MELTYRAAMQLTYYGLALLGRVECPGRDTAVARDNNTLFRTLTPVIKLWTAKKCVAAISEAMESLGGQGYMEDVGLGRLYRDAQVNTIWEGTTNILSLDLLRVLTPNRGEAFQVLDKVSSSHRRI